jgi:cysteinyl-tRNA synthetase
MNEDFNTPIAIAQLFEASKCINTIYDQKAEINADTLVHLQKLIPHFIHDILGLSMANAQGTDQSDALIRFILELRQEARGRKDFGTSDKIRDSLLEMGFEIKDGKEGTTYNRIK